VVGEWYRETTNNTLSRFKVAQNDGLNTKEAEFRRAQYGRNELEASKKVNLFKLFVDQLNDVLIVILLVVASVSLALEVIDGNGSYDEPVLILAIAAVIAGIGFINEYRIEKISERLKKLVSYNAKVRRDGRIEYIPVEDLVPGDIVILEEGQKAPADIRLLTVRSLQVDESVLTSDTSPVLKNTFPIDKMVALDRQKNMLFSGTIISSGTAEGVVVVTGRGTEYAKTAHLKSAVEIKQTSIEKKLDETGRKLGTIILAICIVIFVVIFFVSKEALDKTVVDRMIFALTLAVALAVAAIPEKLSSVARLSTTLGARRMAAKNALIRRPSAPEALSSVDVVCTDKTGMLTTGEMTVRKIFTNGKIFEVSGSGYDFEGSFSLDGRIVENFKDLTPILRASALVNNSHIKSGEVIGDPTEAALIVGAGKAGLFQSVLNQQFPRIDEIPFSRERKLMSTINKMEGRYVVLTKGAPELLLDLCDRVLINGRVRRLDDEMRKKMIDTNISMAKESLRVLGFAYKESSEKFQVDDSVESKLVFLGLQGMVDPPRQEVKEVMHRIHVESGIRVLMITGDHIETAKAIAKEVGIHGKAITGKELDELSQEKFETEVEKISIYSRMNPEHKLRIVQALQKHGHRAAMTGDGIRDISAIEAADVGVAMDVKGTDAAKEAADLILLDDQFLTIVNAIEEGRGIFDNVRKFVSYLISSSIAKVLLVLCGALLLRDPILIAVQLLLIKILIDGIPALVLGSDPTEKGIMRNKPGHFQESVISKGVWVETIAYSTLVTILLLWQFIYMQTHHSQTVAVSATFAGLVIYQLIYLITLRASFKIPWLSNPWLTITLASLFVVTIAVVYVSYFAQLFMVGSVNATVWTDIIVGTVIIVVVMKIVRTVTRRVMSQVKPQVHKYIHA
jgi:P-type Ca2+ transporter type 2C